ncbi:MAG: hypothetical protein IPP42_01795 [Saprospiraceae bacterium]|nr:hypothetical protein [Saprospiraceae bacterium]
MRTWTARSTDQQSTRLMSSCCSDLIAELGPAVTVVDTDRSQYTIALILGSKYFSPRPRWIAMAL